MKKTRFLLIILLLAALLAACGGDNAPAANTNDGGEEAAVAEATEAEPTPAPTETPEPEPTETPVPTETPEPEPTETPQPEPTAEPADEEEEEEEEEATESEGAIGALDLSFPDTDASDFDSYVIAFNLEFTSRDAEDGAPTQSMVADMRFDNTIPAVSMDLELEGIEGTEEFNMISMAEIGDTAYMSLPGMGCVTSSAAEAALFEENPFEEMMSPESILDELELQDAEEVGEETINGIETTHYTFDETFLDDPEGEIESAEGHIYIAQDGGYVVRMVMDVEGALPDFAQEGTDSFGALHFEFDVSNINEPVEIGIPAGCEDNGAGSDLPMPDDAYEVSSFAGFLSYKTDMAKEDLVAFYEEALAEAGWTANEEESMDLGSLVSMTYNKDGETLTVTITEEEGSEALTVLLMEETPE